MMGASCVCGGVVEGFKAQATNIAPIKQNIDINNNMMHENHIICLSNNNSCCF